MIQYVANVMTLIKVLFLMIFIRKKRVTILKMMTLANKILIIIILRLFDLSHI